MEQALPQTTAMSTTLEPRLRLPARVEGSLRRLALPYASILFGAHPLAGLLALAATLVVPAHGAAGLLGLASASLWARLLGRPLAQREDGFYAFNGLLVGLALGLMFRLSWSLVLVLVLATLFTTLVGTVLRDLAERYIGLPMMSLPFVLGTWLALLAATRFPGLEIALDPAWAGQIGAGVLPGPLELFLHSLGACFFQLSVPSGLLVLLALTVLSRWSVVLAVIGFTAGSATWLALGGEPSALEGHLLGFNFILVAIALGGYFVVLSPASLLLAALAASTTAVLAAATLGALEPLAVPVLALPFVMTTLLIRYALGLRAAGGPLQLVRGVPGSPEQNLARAAFRDRRYPDPLLPLFHLPVLGRWTITQGPHGPQTHQGLWADAWDFEVFDDDGQRFDGAGARVEDFHAFGAPVVAPAAGRVVRVVAHLADNAIGDVDTVNNWGNLVLLWHPGDVYTLLCHLRQHSVGVKEGDDVALGEVVAKVGNSGRSPVPHLHMQAQRSPEIGSPTCPAAFLHVLSQGASDGPLRYLTNAVPATGHAVETAPRDPLAQSAVSLPAGIAVPWRVVRHGEIREDRWVSTIDPLGARHLASSTGARVGIYADASYLTTLGYAGRPNDLLGLFHLGTPRLPLVTNPGVVWEDTLDAGPFVPLWARMLHELARPFTEIGAIRTTTRVRASGRGLVVRTELDAARLVGGRGSLPEVVEIIWAPGRGPVSLRAWRAGTLVVAAEVTA